ncbi:hypothetical protein PG994_000125 [Apiospora phragmitis]|uniref:Uncharacterized protein n=1 Tax=Apiospora phragmitis TaxID=2905665 RepID=A0ABR1X5C5_9PEZI
MATQVSRVRSKAIDTVVPSIFRPSPYVTPVAARQFSTTISTLDSSQAQSGSSRSSTSSNSKAEEQPQKNAATSSHEKAEPKHANHTKTVAELDAEMMKKMSGISGDGGSAGVEYEDGQPVSMKRSVKNNMFRYI